MTTALSDTQVQQYVEEIQRLWTSPDRRVFRVLKQFEKEARASGDNRLSGYAYFHYANVYYSHNEQDAAHVYVRKAIQHLMRSDDAELLARTFNLFALDAQFAGCYDIAQNYFNMGYSLVRDDTDSLVRAILEANLGNLLTEIGEHVEALRHTRMAASVVRRHSTDLMSDQNLAVAHLNIGLNSLHAGKVDKVRSSLKHAERILAGADVEETIRMTLLLLRAGLAFESGDEEQTKAAVQELAMRIAEGPLYNDFIFDFYNFCQKLLREGGIAYMGELVEAIEKCDASGCSAYRTLLLCELTVEYYMQEGSVTRLNKSFERQHRISTERENAQKQMYLYSIELMTEIDRWKAEQEQFRKENERLKARAETDALTKLPNRYALNKALDAACARMETARRPLGVGILDIDTFKQYNDLYGHDQGDQCLCLVADVLRRVAGAYDVFVSRYGGDEFVLIYEDRTDGEIREIMEALRTQMPVRVSQGFYNTIPDVDSKMYDFLSRADAEMYREKKEHG